MLLIKIAAACAGAMAGAWISYYPAEHVSCVVLWPRSNLCGVVSVFLAMPLGFIAGGIAGWLIARGLTARRAP